MRSSDDDTDQGQRPQDGPARGETGDLPVTREAGCPDQECPEQSQGQGHPGLQGVGLEAVEGADETGGDTRQRQQSEPLGEQRVLQSPAAGEPPVEEVGEQDGDACVHGVQCEVEGGVPVAEEQERGRQDGHRRHQADDRGDRSEGRRRRPGGQPLVRAGRRNGVPRVPPRHGRSVGPSGDARPRVEDIRMSGQGTNDDYSTRLSTGCGDRSGNCGGRPGLLWATRRNQKNVNETLAGMGFRGIELLSRTPSGESGIGRKTKICSTSSARRGGWVTKPPGFSGADWIDRERHLYRSTEGPL